MQPIFRFVAMMLVVGGAGLVAYALDAKKLTLAGVIGIFTIGATIALT
jgi:hypothetical protein